MKATILLTGGNAGGKTTSVQRALDELRSESADFLNSMSDVIENIRADNDGRFKGEAENQEAALTELWLSDKKVLMVEGTRINTPLMRVAKKYPQERVLNILLALQPAEIMRAHLKARCEKANKTYRAEYWTFTKLEYEGMKRYRNSFRKNGFRAEEFHVDLEYKVQDRIVARLKELIMAAVA